MERLAFDDPATAGNHWQILKSHFSFSAEQINNADRHIALWAARMHLPQSLDWLSSLPDQARDVETGRWLVRAQLMRLRWLDVIVSIDAMQPDESQKDEWQYWKAVALQETGRDDEAAGIFAELADERGYYGFLAADAIDLPYASPKRQSSIARRSSKKSRTIPN